MLAAIEEANNSRMQGDYAIGAVIAKGNEILVRVTNRSKLDQDATAHAEVRAIREASRALKTRYLEGCILYTTHEPCPMCASAAVWAKLKGIVFGARMLDMSDYHLKNGNDEWKWRVIAITCREVLEKGDPKIELIEDYMRDECLTLFHT